MDTAEQALRDFHVRWIEAVNAGDLDRLLDMMSDDVTFVAPGRAPFGREGFREGFSGAHRRSLIRCISEPEELVVVGDIAHTVCRDSLTVTPHDGGPGMALAGYRLTVYRRQPDGRWLLARDCHTLAPVEG